MAAASCLEGYLLVLRLQDIRLAAVVVTLQAATVRHGLNSQPCRHLCGYDLGITMSSKLVGVQGLELIGRLHLNLINKAFTSTGWHCHAMYPGNAWLQLTLSRTYPPTSIASKLCMQMMGCACKR